MNTCEIFSKLSQLHGTWTGVGSGQFPTIESFDYEECLTFEVNSAYPLIHYQQKTILLANQQPSHWESGFIRVINDEVIELSNAQDSGRVEVLQGRVNSCSDESDKLEFESIMLANDPRLISTKRIFQLTKGRLEYRTFMSTRTTPQPSMLPHLHAILSKKE